MQDFSHILHAFLVGVLLFTPLRERDLYCKCCTANEWVENETLKHLNDSNSYTKVTQDEWTIRRGKVIETREKLTHSYSHFLPPTR